LRIDAYARVFMGYVYAEVTFAERKNEKSFRAEGKRTGMANQCYLIDILSAVPAIAIYTLEHAIYECNV